MRSISELNPDYLSQALGSLVDTVEASPLTDGYMADVYHLRLSGAAVPDSLVLKLASSDEVRRQGAEAFNSYGKESFFYRELAADIPVRTPHCYYNPADHFCLLLEDVGRATPGDIDLITAMVSLAALHGSHFPDHSLPGFAEAFRAADAAMTTTGSRLLAELPDSNAVTILRRYAVDTLQLLPRFLAFEQVFSHMDFRSDNLAILQGQLAVFDWGEFCLAPRGMDVATTLVTTCSVEQRAQSEQIVLGVYADAAGIPVEAINDSYRLSLLPLFYLPMLMRQRGAITHSERLLERLLAAINDHADFLDDVLD